MGLRLPGGLNPKIGVDLSPANRAIKTVDKKLDKTEKRINDLKRRGEQLRRKISGQGAQGSGIGNIAGVAVGTALITQAGISLSSEIINATGIEEGGITSFVTSVGVAAATGFAFGGPLGVITALIAAAVVATTQLVSAQKAFNQKVRDLEQRIAEANEAQRQRNKEILRQVEEEAKRRENEMKILNRETINNINERAYRAFRLTS